MGLFGNLFEKKNCDVCGEKIGLLGNRKLEDGNLCKDCAGKLSPWFSERRHSTLEEIKAQLAYREGNRAEVAAFHVTTAYGAASTQLQIDETARKFAVCATRDLTNGNPDIIEIAKVISVDTESKEYKEELKQKDSEGKMVSYNPPRYEYSYDFFCTIRVDHPYIDEIKFKLNNLRVKRAATATGGIVSAFAREVTDDYGKFVNMGNDVVSALKKTTGAAASAAAAGEETESINGKTMHRYQDAASGLDLDLSMEYTATVRFADFKVDGVEKETLKKGLCSIAGSSLTAEFLQESMKNTHPDQLASKFPTMIERVQRSLQVSIPENKVRIAGVSIDRLEVAEKDKALLEKLRSLSSTAGQNVAPAGNAAENAAAMAAAALAATTAATTAESGEWVCPSCLAKNTGKFCEYCGTPAAK